jgi:hypothetical protein
LAIERSSFKPNPKGWHAGSPLEISMRQPQQMLLAGHEGVERPKAERGEIKRSDVRFRPSLRTWPPPQPSNLHKIIAKQ